MGFQPSSSWLFGDKYQMLVEELGKDYEAGRTLRKSPTLPGGSRGDQGSLPTAGGTDTKAWRLDGTFPGCRTLQAECPGWVKERRLDEQVGLGQHQGMCWPRTGNRWSHLEALYPEVLRAQTT